MFKIERVRTNDVEVVRLIDEKTGGSAAVLPSYGFNCSSFKCQLAGTTWEMLYATPTFPSADDRATGNGTPILLPFPNRIRAGAFRYHGRSFQLPCNEVGKNAIHGFAVDQPWRVTEEQADEKSASVTGEFQLSVDRPDCLEYWPGDFRTAFTYRLSANTLETNIVVENTSDAVVPFGVGTHPYFRFPLQTDGDLSQCEIQSPAEKLVELIECLPTGQMRDVTGDCDLRKGLTLDQRTFDDVFTMLHSNGDQKVQHRLLDHQAKVALTIEHDTEFAYSVVYTPPHRQAICIEPYTCITDAVNLDGDNIDSGLWHLHPGEIRHLSIRYIAEAL